MNASAPAVTATERFRVSSREVISVLAMRHGLLWGAVCALPVVVAVVLGFTLDVRFFILALMVLMIFVPLVGAFLYFNHGLRPATALNTVDHSLRLDREALVVTVYPRKVLRNHPDVLDPEAFRRESEEPEPAPRDVRLPYSELTPYTVGLTSLILPAGSRGMLLIPATAFKAPASLTGFAETLAARCGWPLTQI